MINGQTYTTIGNATIEGNGLLRQVFELEDMDDYSTTPYQWACAGIVVAFVLLFRILHLGLLWMNNRKLGSMTHFGSSNSTPTNRSMLSASVNRTQVVKKITQI